ncbi:MAG: hypothetical protein EA392_13965 [Cryomorphaceae bacterium]|nr:MAG: hypothetical protein EA392_13965 [Cryomorphaceae bacterium]
MRSPVKIYTVHVCDEEDWRDEYEFENWMDRHETLASIVPEYLEILKWLKIASSGRRNLSTLLREEQKAHAFPPKARFLELDFQEHLRLYCMLIGQKTIILFNGAIKSKGKHSAQECTVVKPFFDEANRLCSGLEKAIRNQELDVDYETGELRNIDDSEILI